MNSRHIEKKEDENQSNIEEKDEKSNYSEIKNNIHDNILFERMKRHTVYVFMKIVLPRIGNLVMIKKHTKFFYGPFLNIYIFKLDKFKKHFNFNCLINDNNFFWSKLSYKW